MQSKLKGRVGANIADRSIDLGPKLALHFMFRLTKAEDLPNPSFRLPLIA